MKPLTFFGWQMVHNLHQLMMMTHHYSGYWSLCEKYLNPMTLIQHKTVAPCNSKPNKYHKVLATSSMPQALCSYLKRMPVQPGSFFHFYCLIFIIWVYRFCSCIHVLFHAVYFVWQAARLMFVLRQKWLNLFFKRMHCPSKSCSQQDEAIIRSLVSVCYTLYLYIFFMLL